MNFNVYIDKTTGEQLEQLAKARHKSRNAVIREALMHLVEQQSSSRWPREVLEFQGISKLRPFESLRLKLGAPPVDPLA